MVLTSDHGEMAGSHGLYGKGVMYEEATRIPFLVRHPSGARGRTDVLVSSVDLNPTLLDLCGLPPASGAEGISYGPLIRGEAQNEREAVYMQYREVAMRRGPYKLMADAQASSAYALYDLHTDPYEQANLIDYPGHRQTAEEMLDQLRNWLQDVKLRVGEPAEATRPSPAFGLED